VDVAAIGIVSTSVVGLGGIAAAFFAPTWSQMKIERRREARDFRKAQRLVADELDMNARVLALITSEIEKARVTQCVVTADRRMDRT
jgi:hypothetical protein